jgi:hypothetical protein
MDGSTASHRPPRRTGRRAHEPRGGADRTPAGCPSGSSTAATRTPARGTDVGPVRMTHPRPTRRVPPCQPGSGRASSGCQRDAVQPARDQWQQQARWCRRDRGCCLCSTPAHRHDHPAHRGRHSRQRRHRRHRFRPRPVTLPKPLDAWSENWSPPARAATSSPRPAPSPGCFLGKRPGHPIGDDALR